MTGGEEIQFWRAELRRHLFHCTRLKGPFWWALSPAESIGEAVVHRGDVDEHELNLMLLQPNQELASPIVERPGLSTALLGETRQHHRVVGLNMDHAARERGNVGFNEMCDGEQFFLINVPRQLIVSPGGRERNSVDYCTTPEITGICDHKMRGNGGKNGRGFCQVSVPPGELL
jgi:hypothetical protein